MKFKLVESFDTNVPDKLYHATHKDYIESIKKNGLGNTNNKKYSDSKQGVVCLADDPWVAQSYAETTDLDDVDLEWEDEDIVILEIDSNRLDMNRLFVDKNVLLDEDEEPSSWEYHGIIPWSSCKVMRS